MFDLEAFLIGTGVGLISAIVGAIIDYRIMNRKGREEAGGKGRLPGCMFLMSGSLGFVGIVVIFLSFIVSSLGRALTAGLGVGLGFALGFLIMFSLSYFGMGN